MNAAPTDVFQFKIPWHPVENGDAFDAQCYREVGPGHPLFKKKVIAIARRQDMDDVLFYLPEVNQYAITHLTWSQKQQDPPWPASEIIPDTASVQKRLEEDGRSWVEDEDIPLNETGAFVAGKKRIIIVGASSGIGKEMARQYAIEGNLVAVTGRRTELLQDLKRSFTGRIIDACFDVTKDNNKEQLESLVERLGGLDILIISAGTGEPSKELSWEIDKRTVETNVIGFVEIANWGFNYFSNQGHGQLAVISSIAAIRGGSWAPAYNASKAFQSHYFEGLAFKAAKMKKNVTVTCIEPGFVDTKMAKSDKLFWVVPVEKASRQIIRAIDKKKRKAYVSRRWWLIAKVLKWMPHWLYKKLA